MAASKSSRNSLRFSRPWVSVLLAAMACAAVMACAASYFYGNGSALYFGDAEAHLNIARRIIDSRTPGWEQVGTTWLPLPHLLLIPLVRDMHLWQTGLAGVITGAFFMAVAGTFLFAAIRRIFDSALAAAGATAVFLLNPNTLYLGSSPMTEPVYFAAFFVLLYFTVRYGDTGGVGAAVGAGIASCAASLTRYEGWFLIPFAAAYILVAGRGRIERIRCALAFTVVAAFGPVLWLLHNRYYFGDPLYFFRGPWSAAAIQGGRPYPGMHDWPYALDCFVRAGGMLAGKPALVAGSLGVLVALARNRAWWPVLLTLLPVGFYVWSMTSFSTPVYVPTIWPNSWYNSRYAMAFLPVIALGVAALGRFGKVTILVAVAACFAMVPFEAHSVTWTEAEHNSRVRRAWTADAAEFLAAHANAGQTFLTSFGDLTGILRLAGIPLRNTLIEDNHAEYYMAATRPDLFLKTDWLLLTGGDAVQDIMIRNGMRQPQYELSERVTKKGAGAIEIYHRVYENPIREIPRSEERLPADVGR